MVHPQTFFILIICLFLNLCRSVAQTEVLLLKTDSFTINKHLTATELARKNGDKKEESAHWDAIALIYWDHNAFRKAIEYFTKSLELNRQLDNLSGVSMLSSNLGALYADLKEYHKSLDCFNQTLAYRRMKKEKLGIITTLINISVVLNNLKKYPSSVAALQEALTLSREMNDMDQMKSCYGMLSETYEKAHKSDSAYYYFTLYRSWHEKIIGDKEVKSIQEVKEANLKLQLTEIEKQNKELALKLANTEIVHQEGEIKTIDETRRKLFQHLSKAELQNKLLRQENLIKDFKASEQKAEAKVKSQQIRFLRISLTLGAVVVILMLLLFVYIRKKNKLLGRQNKEILAQKLQIEEQQTLLTDSINYSRYIQNAMLRRGVEFENIVTDGFILLKPKSVVSGDFYWFTKIDTKTIIVAADCTGHGVPGALMSMIGINLLNQIVEINKTVMPNQILEELHKGIVFALSQAESSNRDGMDAAVVMFEENSQTIHFAGAIRPMIVVSDGKAEVIKGDKRTVGGGLFRGDTERKFTPITFELQPGSYIYLYSDGFTDQFGGEKRKKFTSHRFLNLLSEIYVYPGNVQGEKLSENLATWQGSESQLDDILVIGFRPFSEN
jgi:serine phosphatase RsbU (regulator of sigma subunit)